MEKVAGLRDHLSDGRWITGASLLESRVRVERADNHAMKVASVRPDYIEIAVGRTSRIQGRTQAWDDPMTRVMIHVNWKCHHSLAFDRAVEYSTLSDPSH